MALLSSEDREQFRQNGYLVVEDAVPESTCDALVERLWETLGHDPDDPETWYTPPEGMAEQMRWGSMGGVEMYHQQPQWDIRQHPTVYQAFAEVLGEPRLWTSFERCNFAPPSHPDFNALDIHVDQPALGLLEQASVAPDSVPDTFPRPYNVQGIVMLDDVGIDEGGTTCVPSLYRRLEEWVDTEVAGKQLSKTEINEEILSPPESDIEQITGNKGDLLIWDTLLPHGQAPNHSEQRRAAMYIRMEPAGFGDTRARQKRLEEFEAFHPDPRVDENGTLHETPHDPREWEQAQGREPSLTALGEKLLGLAPWPGWDEMEARDYPYPLMFSR